jgi:hypothetical protein
MAGCNSKYTRPIYDTNCCTFRFSHSKTVPKTAARGSALSALDLNDSWNSLHASFPGMWNGRRDAISSTSLHLTPLVLFFWEFVRNYTSMHGEITRKLALLIDGPILEAADQL